MRKHRTATSEEEPKSLLKMSIEGPSFSCHIANPQTIHQAENGTIKPGQHTWNGSRAFGKHPLPASHVVSNGASFRFSNDEPLP